jgi:hypothetical protein
MNVTCQSVIGQKLFLVGICCPHMGSRFGSDIRTLRSSTLLRCSPNSSLNVIKLTFNDGVVRQNERSKI